MNNEPRKWRPPRRFQIGLFHVSHPHHGVEREEIPYSADTTYEVPGLRERWKPGAVFIVLRCKKCRSHLVLDVVDTCLPDTVDPRGPKGK